MALLVTRSALTERFASVLIAFLFILTTVLPENLHAGEFSLSSAAGHPQSAAGPALSPDEAGVYTALFANLFEAAPGRPIVLEDRTSIGVPPGMWATTSVQGPDTQKFLAKLSPETRADYQAKMKRSVRFPQNCSLAPECTVMDAVSLTGIVVTKTKNDKGWKNFFSKFPNAPGILLVSRIGFNRDNTEAIVYAGKSCGTLCGEGYYVRLTKIGEHWTVADQTTIWIA